MAQGSGARRSTYLTTHQVARLLGVSLPTVVNWIESGKLGAHRTPGGHRRIAREQLLRFSREYSYPLPPEFVQEEGPLRILVIEADPDMAQLVQAVLEARGGYEVSLAVNAFEAGYKLATFHPDVVLVDLHLGGLDTAGVLRAARAQPGPRRVRVFACSAMSERRLERVVNDFDGHLEKPIRLEQLQGKLQ